MHVEQSKARVKVASVLVRSQGQTKIRRGVTRKEERNGRTVERGALGDNGRASGANVVDELIDASASVGGESKGDIETKELSSPTTRVGRVTSVAEAGSKMGL